MRAFMRDGKIATYVCDKEAESKYALMCFGEDMSVE